MPATIKAMQNRRQTSAGSEKSNIPKATVPTVPTPGNPQKRQTERHGQGRGHGGPWPGEALGVFQADRPTNLEEARHKMT